MIAIMAAAWLASIQTPDAAANRAFEQRMRGSAEAAQALQGPLDGRWAVTDRAGRPLYILEIADPPHAAAPPTAAWSDPHTGALGGVDSLSRAGAHLRLTFTPDPAAGTVRLSLRRQGSRTWTGWAEAKGLRRAIRLKRL